jgi:hypothetical protein
VQRLRDGRWPWPTAVDRNGGSGGGRGRISGFRKETVIVSGGVRPPVFQLGCEVGHEMGHFNFMILKYITTIKSITS